MADRNRLVDRQSGEIEALPVKLGSPSVAMPGFEIDILDDAGRPRAADELEAIALEAAIAALDAADHLGCG